MRKIKLLAISADSLDMNAVALRKRHLDMKLSLDRNDIGAGDTLRYNVLTDVLDENYDRAIAAIEEYRDLPSPYPSFKPKVERLLSYAIDVVYAVRAKKSFTGLSHLTMAKQKEFVDRFKQHIIELKAVLKKIELIEHKVKLEDSRSTLIFIKACWYSVLGITVSVFVLFSGPSFSNNAFKVFEDGVTAISEMIW